MKIATITIEQWIKIIPHLNKLALRNGHDYWIDPQDKDFEKLTCNICHNTISYNHRKKHGIDHLIKKGLLSLI